jgi:nucleoside-triphosphatase
MSKPQPVILLTGKPGVGKTTIIRHIVELTKGQAGGFYTREIRRENQRTGFEIVTLAGETSLLATKDKGINFPRPAPFVGWKVNLDGIDRVAVPALWKAAEAHQLIILDEIGPMEIFSEPFRRAVSNLLDDESISILGTIVQRPYTFADEVKAHPRVNLVVVTLANRDRLVQELPSMLKAGINRPR